VSRLAILSLLFWVAVAWSAVAPLNPHDYWLEIATPVGGYFLLAATRRRFRFTSLAYTLMFFEGLVLVVGAHYTHERVPPFDWIRDAFSLQRNHYDRFAHFCVGLLLVSAVLEILARTSPLRGRYLKAMSVVSILAFAGFYEITEWWIAALTSPETGAAYLGAQGDPWDAQKDMLLDTLGAMLGLALFGGAHERKLAGRAG
jgi:putative membrane protein